MPCRTYFYIVFIPKPIKIEVRRLTIWYILRDLDMFLSQQKYEASSSPPPLSYLFPLPIAYLFDYFLNLLIIHVQACAHCMLCLVWCISSAFVYIIFFWWYAMSIPPNVVYRSQTKLKFMAFSSILGVFRWSDFLDHWRKKKLPLQTFIKRKH